MLLSKYTPRELNAVLGHRAQIHVLRAWMKRPGPPSAYILYGPPGIGKTLVATLLCRAHGKFTSLNPRARTFLTDLSDVVSCSGRNRAVLIDDIEGLVAPREKVLALLRSSRAKILMTCNKNPLYNPPFGTARKTLKKSASMLCFNPPDFSSVQRRLTMIARVEKVPRVDTTVLRNMWRSSNGDLRNILGSLQFYWRKDIPIKYVYPALCSLFKDRTPPSLDDVTARYAVCKTLGGLATHYGVRWESGIKGRVDHNIFDDACDVFKKHSSPFANEAHYYAHDLIPAFVQHNYVYLTADIPAQAADAISESDTVQSAMQAVQRYKSPAHALLSTTLPAFLTDATCPRVTFPAHMHAGSSRHVRGPSPLRMKVFADTLRRYDTLRQKVGRGMRTKLARAGPLAEKDELHVLRARVRSLIHTIPDVLKVCGAWARAWSKGDVAVLKRHTAWIERELEPVVVGKKRKRRQKGRAPKRVKLDL